jgi:hypothetical protein
MARRLLYANHGKTGRVLGNLGKQFAEPILVLFFNCSKEIAKQYYQTRNLEEWEADASTTALSTRSISISPMKAREHYCSSND